MDGSPPVGRIPELRLPAVAMYVMRVELHDDLAAGGCPICRGATRSTRAWLLDLLREIDDFRVQEALDRDGGLCPSHVRRLLDVARESDDSLGLGIVLEHLLRNAFIPVTGPPRRSVRLGGSRRIPPAPTADRCAACKAQQVRIDAYLEILLDASDAATHELAHRPENALCKAHLQLALARRTHDRTAPLERAARLHVRSLIDRVRTSQRAHTYGSTADRGVHEVLWRDAPDWLAGRR